MHAVTPWPSIGVNEGDIPPYTEDEVRSAAARIKGKKSPGPDMIAPEIIKGFVMKHAEYVTRVANRYLRDGEFPKYSNLQDWY